MQYPHQAPIATPAAVLGGLAAGDHVCLVGEDETELLAAAVPFVRFGLERGEKCIYVADEGAEGKVVDALIGGGVEVGPARAAGRLVLTTPKAAHLKGDALDAYRMYTFWKRAGEEAAREGFPALRCIGDTAWLLAYPPDTERWMAYEGRLTQLAQDVNCSFLCQYGRKRMPAELMPGIIRSHPVVVYRGTVCENIHFARPGEFIAGPTPACDMQILLDTLWQHQQATDALRRDREALTRLELRSKQEFRIRCALDASAVPFEILQAVRNESHEIVDFLWTYVNRAAAYALGRTQSELVGRRVTDVIPTAWDPAGLFSCFAQVAETGEHSEIEVSATHESVQRWWENIVSKNDDCIVLWFRDITERKVADHELQRSVTYLAEGQRFGHTGSWAWDVATREISFWSIEHYRIMGLDPAMGLPPYVQFAPMVHPDDLAFIERNFNRAVDEQVEFDHGYRVARPDGSLRHVHTFGRPVFARDGKLTEYVGTIIDITGQRRAEEALRQAQAEMARVSRVMTLGDLAASVAHEVAQPLASMVADTAAALRWLADGARQNIDEVRLALGRVAASGRRAREVIERIRSMVNKTGGNVEEVDINAAVSEAISMTRDELKRSDIALRTDLDASLPSVQADRVQIRQVLLNVIINAHEAINMQSRSAREVVIRTYRDGADWIHVAVRDSGVGLGPGDPQALFASFYTTKPHGMGMGLAISRTIVQAHGGKLWAARNDGDEGATFHFTLPVQEHDA